MIRIALRSERSLFADLLAAELAARPEYAVVGHVADLADLPRLCVLRRPDLAVVHLAGGLGPDADRTLAGLRTCLGLSRVVVLHDQFPAADLGALTRVGVATMVPCAHGLDALLVVLRRCVRADGPPCRRPGAQLTEIEEQIIGLLSTGHTVVQLARQLGVSQTRVANAKRRIYRKLGVDSQAKAVATAATLGILTRPHPQPRPLRKVIVPAEESSVELRGPEGEVRSRVTAVLRTAGIRVCAGAPVLLLVDPAGTDWPEHGVAAPPVVLVLSAAPRRVEVLAALLRGAVAVVTADRVADDLAATMRLSTRGFVALDASASSALLETLRVPSTPDLRAPVLTSREIDILHSIADGDTVRRTAQVLGIAEKTVENIQGRLFRKLGASNRLGALAAAHAFGLMPDRPRIG